MFFSDLTDEEWEMIEPMLPPQKPKIGRPAHDHRNVVNAILWVKRNGAAWRHLPEHYGPWPTAASRYYRWCKAGVWGRIQAALGEPSLRSAMDSPRLNQLDSVKRTTRASDVIETAPSLIP